MIGTMEMVAIVVAALFLFGPQKLPELARSIGHAVGEFKKAQMSAEMELPQFDSYKQKTESNAAPRATEEKAQENPDINKKEKVNEEVKEEKKDSESPNK